MFFGVNEREVDKKGERKREDRGNFHLFVRITFPFSYCNALFAKSAINETIEVSYIYLICTIQFFV